MKSTFLFAFVVTAMMANVASAQMSTRPSPKDMVPNNKTHFDKFWDRMKIGYFGVATTPHLDDIEKGQWRNGAISPEFQRDSTPEAKNQDTWPVNVWNQISFNYNFGAKLNFVVNPRFVTMLAHPKDMEEPERKDMIMIDDVLIGFQGVILSLNEKKFNLWIRPGIRIPTSKVNRNSTGGGAGLGEFQVLSNQTELAYNATYDFTKTWQVGLFGQFRQWVFEDQFGFDRFRIYTAPFVQYTIDDVSRVQVYYENIIETDRRGKPADDRDPVFKDKWQNVFAGYSRDFTKKFNAMPFVGVFVNDEPVTDKSVWFGAWISYTIK